MGFYINYSQIRSYFLRMDNRIASLGALLDVMDAAWDEILNEESMQGKAAEAIKTYIKEFHKPVIRSIKVLLEEFYDKMLLYMEDYYAHIDAGADTVLGEDGFAAYEELMDMDLNKLSYWDQELERILDSIRGYCDISKPDLGGLETVNRSLTMRMRHLAEDTAAMEAAHMEDTEGPEELLESIRKVIADNAWQAQALENIYEIPAVNSADMMHMNSISGRENGMMHTVEMEERLSEALQSERVRRLEERRQGGIEQGIYGAECMLIGGYAIVATGGAAIPIYVTALAAGTGSIAYGFSELAEGVHNYELGSRGDLETASYNILRDEVFFGDQACYDTFGRTAVFISGVIPTVSSLYEWGSSRSVSGQVSGGEGDINTISYTDYDNIYQNSIHNPDADAVMLGKYDGGGPTSYIAQAGDNYTYFSIDNWDVIKAKYNFTDEDMFRLFNESFLDDGINARKTFYFSHDPRGDTGALGQELKYLEQNGYFYNIETMSASFNPSRVGVNGLIH